MLSICASTVLIKQHSILDVIWAVILPRIISYNIFNSPIGRVKTKKRETVASVLKKTIALIQGRLNLLLIFLLVRESK